MTPERKAEIDRAVAQMLAAYVAGEGTEAPRRKSVRGRRRIPA